MKKLRIFSTLTTLTLATVAAATTPETATTSTTQAISTSYQDYNAKAFTTAKDMQRVLFFHASWCPACKKADSAFEKDAKNFPKNLNVFKVNYDKEKALRKKYGITGQHTFVLVNAKGDALKKWVGGSTKELLAKVKGQ